MKKLMMTMALVAMTFAGRATEVRTLDDSAAMPGSFWTITSPDGKTLNALASVVLAPRGRHAISLALYFNIDVSAGVVYGSDFSLDHYYMENQ